MRFGSWIFIHTSCIATSWRVFVKFLQRDARLYCSCTWLLLVQVLRKASRTTTFLLRFVGLLFSRSNSQGALAPGKCVLFTKALRFVCSASRAIENKFVSPRLRFTGNYKYSSVDVLKEWFKILAGENPFVAIFFLYRQKATLGHLCDFHYRESCSRKRCFRASFRAILGKFRNISHRDKDHKAIYTEDNKFH